MRRNVQADRLDWDSRSGLSSAEARRRLTLYGPNAIVEKSGSALRDLLVDTLKDPMLWFLLATACLFFTIGQWREAVILVLAIIPLTGMDAFLHWRTAASTRDLQSRLAQTARVMRDQQIVNLPTLSLVPGDLVVVRSGEFFPADGIILMADDAQVDESALTGESLPLKKVQLADLPAGKEPPIAAEHWGFAGTKLLVGEIQLKLAFTGSDTFYGEIIQSVQSSGHEQTALQKSIALLVKKLLLAAVAFCIVLAITRLMQGKGFVDAIVSAATLAIAAIPEEFPVVFTFFLGVGVYRMARRKALVRRAVSVENLGRVTCICSDKTGTLTEGQLRLAHWKAGEGLTETTLFEIAQWASRADSSDPLDQAILGAAPALKVEGEKISVFPFTEKRRRETAIVDKGDEQLLVAVKGAPEEIFKRIEAPASDLKPYLDLVSHLARDGHKLIACAQRFISKADWDGEEPQHGFTLVGLLAFEDPVREAVPSAIKACRQAKIHVLMITGDHPDTAGTIAREIGLGGTHPQVYNAEDDDFEQKDGTFFKSIDVVARALPAQKLAIVLALKAQGELVAVTGDGINDVPALQAADIGIAMGGRGTRSAREVASIVLLDDNFATVVGAIAEGRQLLENLKRSFQYLLTVHIPLVTTAALLPLLGFPIVYLPIHIVWIELLIHPTALLAFQDESKDELFEPSGEGSAILTKSDWWTTLSAGVLASLIIIGLYIFGLESGTDYARTLAIISLLLTSIFSAAALCRLRTRAARIVLGLSFVSLFVFTEIPFFAEALHVDPPNWEGWLLILATIAVAMGISLGGWSILRRWHKRLFPNWG